MASSTATILESMNVANTHLACLRSQGILRTNIDATPLGSVARYINHSCAPNLDMHPARHGLAIPSAALFANTDIAPGVR